MKKRTLVFTSALLAAGMLPASADLIIHEPFAYTVPSNNPDPDGGLNGGNGLPATNVGGNPSGTSTGLRGNWGTTLDVAAGLSYPGFPSSGGAGAPNNATWGTDVYIYRNMTTDPYLSQRIGGVNNGNFGVDGTSLWFSALVKTTSVTAQACRFKVAGNTNMFIENTADKWTFNYNGAGAVASTGNMTVGATALLVWRIDFVAGEGDVFSLWVDPTPGGTLGTPNATYTTANDWGGLNNINLRPAVAGAMTIDEFRMGTTEADVLPTGGPDTTPPEWSVGFPNSSLPNSAGFTLNARTNESGTVYYVVLPDGASAPSAAQVKAGQDASSTPVSPSGSIGVTANVTASAAVSGLTASTDYDVYLVAEDGVPNLQTTPVLLNAATESASGVLIIDEGFDYTLSTNDPDPDGGVNGGNGLPATNVGGNPSGTSTGLRGNWGTSLDVADGLTYTGLLTSGGAGAPNNATWGTGNVIPYRFMATDPFLSYREGAANNGAFGADGTTLYLSMLMKLGDDFDSTTVARVAIGATEGNIYVGANLGDNDATPNWGLARGSTGAEAKTTIAANAGDTALLVLRYTFGASNVDTVELWVNPALDQPLGTPDAALNGANSGNFAITNFNTRPDTVGAFVFDELRMGTAAAAVMPQDNPPANNYASWAAANNVTGGVNGDSDNDGITNGMEYALQTNLTGSDGSLGTLTGNLLSFSKRADAVSNGDVTYFIETSPNLSPPWTTVTPDANNGSIISYTLPTGQGKLFARLRVEIAP